MANLLEGLDLYYAGVMDVRHAEQRATERMLTSQPAFAPGDYAGALREELDRLCQARIERGELPAPVEATSEAA